MPDYNPAVAAGIQVPQAPQPLNFGQTLSTVADFQRAQAATALSQLQALQVQRKYNGVLATQQALAHGGSPSDAFQAGVRAGADPADITNALAAASNANFMGSHNNLNPQGAEAVANIARTGAETANARAQLPGFQAKSAQSDMELRGNIANSLANDTSDDNWKATLPQLTGHVSPQGWAQILDAYKNPDKRAQVAKNMQAAAIPPKEYVTPQQIDATKGLLAPSNILGAPNDSTGQPGQPGMPGQRPMSPQEQEQQKLAAQRSDKTYTGIQAQAAQYERDTKPYLDLSRSILNNPNMYTGIAGNRVLDWNRVKAALGDTQAAMLQEGLQKVTATSVLGQINQQRDQLMEAGGTSGRIFSQQVDLVEKAAPQLASTLAGNRFLVEVSGRMGELNTTIRDMAADYKTKHGILDAGFDKEVSQYMKSHPIFTQQELARPELLGSPTAPAGLKDTQSRKAWGQGMGLSPGDPFRVNGQYKYWGGQ
jgi:hypothetical protein